MLKEMVEEDIAAGKKDRFFGDAINGLIIRHALNVEAIDVTGEKWGEIDYENDLLKARELFAGE